MRPSRPSIKNTSRDGAMQSGPVLGPGSLISEGGRILELVFQDPFYAIYSAEAAHSGATIGITEYFPADLVARAPGDDVVLRSLEAQDLFDLGRDRFTAEARALSALRHPSLLRFDGVVSDHGTAFALHAPEEGQSITSLVKSSKHSPTQEEIDAILKSVDFGAGTLAFQRSHSRQYYPGHHSPAPGSAPDPLWSGAEFPGCTDAQGQSGCYAGIFCARASFFRRKGAWAAL